MCVCVNASRSQLPGSGGVHASMLQLMLLKNPKLAKKMAAKVVQRFAHHYILNPNIKHRAAAMIQ